MYGTQLLPIIAAVLISNNAQTQPASGQRQGPSLNLVHPFVVVAHEANMRAFQILGTGFAKSAIQRLTGADKLVVEALQKPKRQDFINALRDALKAELGALVLMKAHCYSPMESGKPPEEAICKLLYREVGSAIAELILAIIESHGNERKRNQLRAIHRNFLAEMYPNLSDGDPYPEDLPTKLHDLGHKILKATQ